jgi:hypothetical protein
VRAEAGSILLGDQEKEELIFQYSIGGKPVQGEAPFPGIGVFQDLSSNSENLGLRDRSTATPAVFTRSTRPLASLHGT